MLILFNCKWADSWRERCFAECLKNASKASLTKLRKNRTSYFLLTKRTRLLAQAQRWERQAMPEICSNRRWRVANYALSVRRQLLNTKNISAKTKRWRDVFGSSKLSNRRLTKPAKYFWVCVRVLKKIIR